MPANFNDLEQAIDPSVALDPVITAEKTAFQDEELDDATALGLALTDVQAGLAYLQSKTLMPTAIDMADDLIRGYVKPRLWPDGKARANLPMYVVLEAIEKLMPTLYMALFGTGRQNPFLVTPVGSTTPEAARAKGSVLGWAAKQANLKEKMRQTLKTCLSYGFCVGWTGWESRDIRKKIYTKKDGKMKGEWKEVPMNLPCYDNVPLKTLIFDPHCLEQNVQNGAQWVAKQVMITANDLQWMREDTEHYKNIPSDDELRVILSSLNEPAADSLTTSKRASWRDFQAELDSKKVSKDPLNAPLEYIEYVTRDRIIGVLQRCITIRNQPNEKRKLPAHSCAFIDVLGSAWGFGVARLLAGEQRLQQGVGNNWVDSLALVLNPTYQLLKGVGSVGTQTISISPGKVINAGNGELRPLVTPDVTGPAMNAIENSQDRSARRVGANSGGDLPKQALRTSTGVNALSGDVIQRLQYFLEIFIHNIYLPVLSDFLEDCLDQLQPEQINHILSEAEGKAWEGDIADVYNAQCDIDTIAGADLMAKQAAAAMAPQILALVASAGFQDSLDTQGKKFDYVEFFTEWFGLGDWDVNTLIVEQTGDDKQRVLQKNQAAQKGQNDLALQQLKGQQALELANEKGTVEAGVGIVRDAVKGHIDAAQQVLGNLESGGGE